MCFHYSLTKERTDIELLLHADWDDEGWQPVYHADGFTFPGMPVITQEEPGRIRLMHWGLIPHWIKTKAAADDLRKKTLNARSETLFEKPSFRGYIMNQRCGVIADGFFEWMDFQKKKFPHYIFLEGHPLFYFAGIYSRWTDPATGEYLSTFSIITTEANLMMARIHNLKQRMPVILSPNQCRKWLDPELSKEDVMGLLQPYPEATMRSRTISRLITSRTHDSNVPEVLENQVYTELRGLP